MSDFNAQKTAVVQELESLSRQPTKNAPARKPADPGDPWLTTTQRFLLRVDGFEIGTFTGVSGLNVEVSVDTIKEGGQNHFVHQMPGRMTWPNIVLKRGVVNDDNLFDWFEKTSGQGFAGRGNTVAMHTAAITIITDRGEALREWSIDRAFPVKWTGPTFEVTSTDVPTEELEIAHHGFRPKNL